MNKFVKYGTFIGFVMILAGAGAATAAFAMGANIYKIGRYMEERFDRVHQEYNDYYGAWEGAEEYSNSGWHGEYDELTDLEIKQTGGSVQLIYTDETETMTIDCDSGSIESTSYTEDGIRKKLTVRASGDAQYVINIPYEWMLKSLEAKVINGRFDGENLQASELEIHVNEGTAYVTQAAGGALELECTRGELNWTGCGETIPMIEAESGNGGSINIIFENPEAGEGYSYKLETRGGTITLPDLVLEGEANKKIPGTSAAGIMDIEAKDRGEVTVSY